MLEAQRESRASAHYTAAPWFGGFFIPRDQVIEIRMNVTDVERKSPEGSCHLVRETIQDAGKSSGQDLWFYWVDKRPDSCPPEAHWVPPGTFNQVPGGIR